MKGVCIDSKNGVVALDGKKIPRLLLGVIRGAVGKCFVVKHYKGGRRVLTRYPDMSGIVASEKQRVCRDLFREAVVYAKWIVADEGRKKAFRKTLPWKRRNHVYQAAIRLYMSMQGDAKWLRKQLAVKAMMRVSVEDVVVKHSNVVWCEGVLKQGGLAEQDLRGQGLRIQGLREQLCFTELEICDISANYANSANSAKCVKVAEFYSHMIVHPVN